jgi:hypothetical protein
MHWGLARPLLPVDTAAQPIHRKREGRLIPLHRLYIPVPSGQYFGCLTKKGPEKYFDHINLPERAELGELGFPLKLKNLSKIFLPNRSECRMKMFSNLF